MNSNYLARQRVLNKYGIKSVLANGCLAFAAALFSVLVMLLIFAPAQTSLAQSQGSIAPQSSINNLRLWHSPDKTRVVFDVSENIKHTVFSLRSPERVVVDIENISMGKEIPRLDAENPHIRSIRIGEPKPNVLRVVFELKKTLEAHSFVLTPNELYAHRLVLDLVDKLAPSSAVAANQDAERATALVLPASGAGQPPALDTAPNTVAQATSESAAEPATSNLPIPSQPLVLREPKKLTIAIDAGHGGEDPGAIGHRGSREKVITLSIANRLQKVINADSRMRAILVRTGDYYIDLNRRRTMAREQGADIFVSIHADAFTKRSANGLSVFALSQRGATSAMAKALADKENASDLIGGVSLANKDVVLAQVLVDLSMTNTISESVNLGGRVLRELAKVGRLHSKRVEQASFVVLKSPDMPSILIETGFITNLDEERKLRSSAYQNKLAKAIHKALGDYYEQTPYYSQASYSSPVVGVGGGATNSARGQAARPDRHKVRRGDSLSSIALKYGTTVAELKRVNKLRRDTVMLGQRLTLPAGNSRASGASTKGVHVVKRGDSLSKISARYNVTINALKRLNGLRSNTLYLGQKIKLPVGSVRGGSTQAAKPTHHKVTRGDTLSEIAERYGVSMSQLMRANNMRSRTVRLGQKLKIP